MRLQLGHPADLVVWDRNPWADPEGAQVVRVEVEGEAVFP